MTDSTPSTTSDPHDAEPRKGDRILGLPSKKSVLLLLLGAVAGFALSESRLLESKSNAVLWAGAMEIDNNGDGKTDAWWIGRGESIARWRSDRNYDGKPDLWNYYDKEQITRDESDENFDGEVDTWTEFRFNEPFKTRYDFDFNGVADETTEYRFGQAVLTRFHPNGRPVERETVYVHGAPRETFDIAADGTRTLVRSYDPVGREITPQARPTPAP